MCSAHATCRRRAVAPDALLTFSARAMISRAGVAAVLVKMEVHRLAACHVFPTAEDARARGARAAAAGDASPDFLRRAPPRQHCGRSGRRDGARTM